ncbi:FAD:protein FMN transferase [Methanosarcinales archaeon]|nr:MAG: FAD:protein FMN transferase [Methanosarcinales archaeon]
MKIFAGIFVFVVFISSLNGCSVLYQKDIYKKTFLCMGTIVSVLSSDKEVPQLAYEYMKELEKKFSIFSGNSQISIINKNAGKKWIEVDKEVFECLKLAKEVASLTEGYFDPTIGPLTLLWKNIIKNKHKIKAPPLEEIEKRRKLVNYEDLLLDEKTFKVFLRRKGQSLDLGGIAKGYIVDKTALFLRKQGKKNFLIDAGGDVFASGLKNSRPWRVAIRHPRLKYNFIDVLNLQDKAVATSGDYEQFFMYKGRRYSHIINPKTGFPQEGVLSVSVVAKNLTTADAFSTAFFAMGLENTKKFLAHNPNNFQVYFVVQKNNNIQIFVF